MKLNVFMAIAAVVAFLFGLSFLLMPVQTMSMYGVTLDASGEYLGRYLGSAFLGVAVLTWLARNAADNEALRAIIRGTFVLCLTGFIVALGDVFLGVGNALVWSTVAIYLLLALGYGYFLTKK